MRDAVSFKGRCLRRFSRFFPIWMPESQLSAMPLRVDFRRQALSPGIRPRGAICAHSGVLGCLYQASSPTDPVAVRNAEPPRDAATGATGVQSAKPVFLRMRSKSLETPCLASCCPWCENPSDQCPLCSQGLELPQSACFPHETFHGTRACLLNVGPLSGLRCWYERPRFLFRALSGGQLGICRGGGAVGMGPRPAHRCGKMSLRSSDSDGACRVWAAASATGWRSSSGYHAVPERKPPGS
jgi:hypothetical protein